MIDPHVHCRDWAEQHKETLEHTLMVADAAGLSAIFDMPNTDPPILSRDRAERRLLHADQVRSQVWYGCYVGLTGDPAQQRLAVSAWRELFPRVVGLKYFAGGSVGPLVVPEDGQLALYRTLAKQRFDGVLAVHCERESLFLSELWDPLNPCSHSFVRHPAAELEAVADQLAYAKAVDFKGTVYIPHVSVPGTLALVREARTEGLKVRVGATPHHCLLGFGDIPDEDGLLYKVNPPLRNTPLRRNLLNYLLAGWIDWIETDHAPHTRYEKLHSPYPSGFPGLPFYPHFVRWLGSKLPPIEHAKLTHGNVCEAFGIDIPVRDVPPDYELHRFYDVDVHAGLRVALADPVTAVNVL